MIETRVRVVSAGNGTAWVAASQESGCAACQSKATCGISGLGKFLSNRRPDLPLQHDFAQAGDELLIGVDETELLRAGLFAYLLPAVLAIVAAAVADALALGDLAAALAAVFGLLLGLLIARFLAPTPQLHAASIPTTISGEPT